MASSDLNQVHRRVKFLQDWDWKPTRQVTIAFKAGETHFVRAECAALALELGVAERTVFKSPTAGIRAKMKRKGKANG